MVQQTVQFESVSLSEVGSGALTAFLFSGATLAATLASVTENGTLKGQYTGTVDDIAAGDYRLVVKFNGFTVSEPDETVSLLLAVGTYVSKRLAVLNSDARVKLHATQPDYAPALAATALSNVVWTNQRAINLDNLDIAISVIQSQIAAQNNLSAKMNISGALLLEVPDSGTRDYRYEIVVRDDEDKLVNLDGVPTIVLTNTAGTDRSALITSAVANVATGRYRLTVTVATGTNNEGLFMSAAGAVSGEARYYSIAPQVVDYDNATQIALLLTRVGIPSVSVSADVAAVSTKIGSPVVSVSSDIAAVKTDTDSLLTRITSGITALIANLTAMITGSGASAKYTVVALSNAPSGGGGGSGTESDLMVSTTIATLTSQTVFTLTEGSADNHAYKDQLIVITDASTATQKWRQIVSAYVGGSMQVTLRAAPGFTIAVGDAVSIIAIGSDVSSTQLAGAVSSAVATAGVATTVTGIPTFLRVGDARTVANGGAIAVRLYDADDDSLLFGLGTQLFADATITFSLRRGGNDGTEGTEEAVIPCTWVASGGDGYVQIAYEGDALDDCDAMDKLKEKDCHRWGIKFQWGDEDPITPVYGTLSVLRKIVSTQ